MAPCILRHVVGALGNHISIEKDIIRRRGTAAKEIQKVVLPPHLGVDKSSASKGLVSNG